MIPALSVHMSTHACTHTHRAMCRVAGWGPGTFCVHTYLYVCILGVGPLCTSRLWVAMVR